MAIDEKLGKGGKGPQAYDTTNGEFTSDEADALIGGIRYDKGNVADNPDLHYIYNVGASGNTSRERKMAEIAAKKERGEAISGRDRSDYVDGVLQVPAFLKWGAGALKAAAGHKVGDFVEPYDPEGLLDQAGVDFLMKSPHGTKDSLPLYYGIDLKTTYEGEDEEGSDKINLEFFKVHPPMNGQSWESQIAKGSKGWMFKSNSTTHIVYQTFRLNNVTKRGFEDMDEKQALDPFNFKSIKYRMFNKSDMVQFALGKNAYIDSKQVNTIYNNFIGVFHSMCGDPAQVFGLLGDKSVRYMGGPNSAYIKRNGRGFSLNYDVEGKYTIVISGNRKSGYRCFVQVSPKAYEMWNDTYRSASAAAHFPMIEVEMNGRDLAK